MKKFKGFTLLVLASFLLLSACSFSLGDSENDGGGISLEAAGDEDLFVSEEGGFAVKFPGEPTFSAEPVDTAAGQITMNGYIY